MSRNPFPKQGYNKASALKLTDEEYNQVVLLVRDTILELSNGDADKEAIDTMTCIFNKLSDNDKYNQLKDYLDN